MLLLVNSHPFFGLQALPFSYADMTVYFFTFILQQQKRYQQIKSSTLVVQSYIRGWKVSLSTGFMYVGTWVSS